MKTRPLFSALLLALSAGTAGAQSAPAPDYTYRIDGGGTAGYRVTITAFHGPFHYRDVPLSPRNCSGSPGTPVTAAAELRLFDQPGGPLHAEFHVPASSGGTSCEYFGSFDLKAADRPVIHEVDPESPPQGQKPRMKEVPEISDLSAADPVQIGPAVVQWGDTATVSATQATRRRGGICYFPYRYLTIDGGPGHVEGTNNSLRLGSATGPLLALDDLPALQPLTSAASEGVIGLAAGTSIVVVEVDAPGYVPETSETNNLRRVIVDVQGSCN